MNAAAGDGLLNGNPGQLYHQLMAVLVTWVYAGGLTFVFAKVVDVLVGLRVNTDEERDGLDLSQHGESGYNFEEARM